MPEYNEQQIRERVKSGKDAKRARGADKLYEQATQPPHDDDAAAMAKLGRLAGDDSTGGYATNDARNYARFLLNQGKPPEQQMEYSEARDGGGFLGSLGGVVKKLAPLAGLIPGIGLPIGAAVGGLGSALGGQLAGDKFDLGSTLGSAAGAGALASWNPFGSKVPDAPDIGGMGSQTVNQIPGKDFNADVYDPLMPGRPLTPPTMPSGGTPTGKPYVPGAGAANNAAYHAALPRSFPEQIIDQFKDPVTRQIDIGKIGQVVGPAAGMIEKRNLRKTQERNANAALALKRQYMGQAEEGYADKAGIRKQALARLGKAGSRPSIFGG